MSNPIPNLKEQFDLIEKAVEGAIDDVSSELPESNYEDYAELTKTISEFKRALAALRKARSHEDLYQEILELSF